MPRYLPEPPQPPVTEPRDGIMLVNLGTPDAPTAPAVRRYLGEFLSDPRVVEIPPLFWQPILRGIILNTRPAKSAKKYASIWLPEGSPLMVYTESLAKKLAARLDDIPVVTAMRYGSPSIRAGLEKLRAEGCNRIVVLPLYPQYAASTVGTVYDAVGAVLRRWRNQPELRFVRHYFDVPSHIEAVKQSVQAYWLQHGKPDTLVMSFHGLPKRCIQLGDPYQQECLHTGRAIAATLDLAEDAYRVTFQSRFGPEKWLEPYTEEVFKALAKDGKKRIDVLCPGFATDCLETLEEIAQEGKETFLNAGGREFHYIPCLNDSDTQVDSLLDIIHRHARH